MIKNNSDNWLNKNGYTAHTLQEYKNWSESGFVYNALEPIRKKSNSIKIIEAGCGSAKLGISLYLKGFRDITLLDFHSVTCQSLENFVKENNLNGIKVINDKIENISENYDVIINEGVMEHFIDIKERLSIYNHFYNHLNKDGILIVYVPCSDGLTLKESEEKWKSLDSPAEIYYTAKLLTIDLKVSKFKDVIIIPMTQSKESSKLDLLLGIGFKL